MQQTITIKDWYSTWQNSPDKLYEQIQTLITHHSNLEKEISEKQAVLDVKKAELNGMNSLLQSFARFQTIVDKHSQDLDSRKGETIRQYQQLIPQHDAKTLLEKQLQHARDARQNYEKERNQMDSLRRTDDIMQGRHDYYKEHINRLESEQKDLNERLDLWMHAFNLQHPPVQLAELDEVFADGKDWSKIRSNLKQINTDTLLCQAKVDDLKDILVEKLFELTKGKVSQGVKDYTGAEIISKGSKFTMTALKNLVYGDVQTSNWTVDEHKNQLIGQLIINYMKKYKLLDAEMKRKKFAITIGDELPSGILQMAKVYVAKKRKIGVGDKLAGRHGNKGIVSKVVRQEDMPFLEDGRPVDLVLNPLGVPSRMNLGQIFEAILGAAGKRMGVKFATEASVAHNINSPVDCNLERIILLPEIKRRLRRDFPAEDFGLLKGSKEGVIQLNIKAMHAYGKARKVDDIGELWCPWHSGSRSSSTS